jgi:hypothetical protein
MPRAEVADRGDDEARDADTEMAFKLRVLAGDDGLPQDRRDVVVANHDPPLGCEFADLLAVAGDQSRDRARLVIVQRADRRDVVRVDEHQAAQCAEERRDDEEREEARPTREPDDNPGAWPERGTAGFSHVSGYRPIGGLTDPA